jgi:RHS repeat-associated protein
MNQTKDTGRCFFRTSVFCATALLVLACGLLAGPAWAQHFEPMEYYHYDALGSVRLVVSFPHDSGTYTISRHDYLPFGEEIQAGTFGRARNLGYGNGDTTPQRFTGKERDPESNLDYFGARYYSGAMGRFTSVDPENAGAHAPDPQSWNAYTYALNQPGRYTDPTGRDPADCYSEPGGSVVCYSPERVDVVAPPLPEAGDWHEADGPSDLDRSSTITQVADLANNVNMFTLFFMNLPLLEHGPSPSGSGGRQAMPEVAALEELAVGRSAASLASTGRTTATSLAEQLAMQQAKSNPAAGSVIPLRGGMKDPRWPASGGWVKMRQNVNGVEIHYLRNTRTSETLDFKFAK